MVLSRDKLISSEDCSISDVSDDACIAVLLVLFIEPNLETVGSVRLGKARKAGVDRAVKDCCLIILE
jgi:hypothetical protein